MEPEHMQAECIVDALDNYLATLLSPGAARQVRDQAREYLVRTLAASLRMSEPRKSDLQKA